MWYFEMEKIHKYLYNIIRAFLTSSEVKNADELKFSL